MPRRQAERGQQSGVDINQTIFINIINTFRPMKKLSLLLVLLLFAVLGVRSQTNVVLPYTQDFSSLQFIRHAGPSIPHQAVCAISIQASEAMLNAETVVVFVFKPQIIGINESAFG